MTSFRFPKESSKGEAHLYTKVVRSSRGSKKKRALIFGMTLFGAPLEGQSSYQCSFDIDYKWYKFTIY